MLNPDLAMALQWLFLGLLASVVLVTWGDMGGLAAVRRIPGVARFFLGLLALAGMVGVLAGPQYFSQPTLAKSSGNSESGEPTFASIDLNWPLQSVADGKEVNLSSLKGKVLFVNVWATWCPPCVAEMPSIETLHSYFADSDDVAFVLASIDTSADLAKGFADKRKMKAPIYHSKGPPPAAFYTQGIPATFIVAKDGTLRFRHVGGSDWSREREKIEALIAAPTKAAAGEGEAMMHFHSTAIVAMLLSQPRPERSTANDLYIYLGLLIGSLFALAIVVFMMKRWYEKSKKDDAAASELTEARELEEEGELTREEFLKIKAKLTAGLTKPKSIEIKGGDPAKRSNPPRRQNPPDE